MCFSDKKIILFATSGGSGFGNTMRELQPSVPNSVIEEGRIFNNTTRQQIIKWVETL
ncbi:flavodoxin [[Clostridium] innocuum]|uniref:flavodoxin n=1 Tax=Clostridium innocuum TaxID=1522 RepID=UPI003259ADCC